jgi:hypothetical protein
MQAGKALVVSGWLLGSVVVSPVRIGEYHRRGDFQPHPQPLQGEELKAKLISNGQ